MIIINWLTHQHSLKASSNHRLKVNARAFKRSPSIPWLLKSATMVLVVSTLSACQNTTPVNSHLPSPSNSAAVNPSAPSVKGNAIQANNQISPDHLRRYHWTLLSATDNQSQPLMPLQAVNDQVNLKFFVIKNTNMMAIETGCNAMNGDYTLLNSVMKVGRLQSTKMSCSHKINGAERQLSEIMGQPSKLALDNKMQGGSGDNGLNNVNDNFNSPANDLAKPVLTQVTPVATLKWQGKLTPEARYNAVAETVYWEVDRALQPCHASASTTCLKVRPVQLGDDGAIVSRGAWGLFAGEIEGYTHDADENKVLTLSRYAINSADEPNSANPTYAYVLDQAVEMSLVE